MCKTETYLKFPLDFAPVLSVASLGAGDSETEVRNFKQ